MSDGIGPDIRIPAGQIGEIFLTGDIVPNEDGTGYTGRTPGGIVSLRFMPEAFAARRAQRKQASQETPSPEMRAKASRALDSWARDHLFRSRHFWACACAIDPGALAALCDEKPDRPRAPMRDEYDRAKALRKTRRNRAHREKSA